MVFTAVSFNFLCQFFSYHFFASVLTAIGEGLARSHGLAPPPAAGATAGGGAEFGSRARVALARVSFAPHLPRRPPARGSAGGSCLVPGIGSGTALWSGIQVGLPSCAYYFCRTRQGTDAGFA